MVEWHALSNAYAGAYQTAGAYQNINWSAPWWQFTCDAGASEKVTENALLTFCDNILCSSFSYDIL